MDLPADSQDKGDSAGTWSVPVIDFDVLINGDADQRSRAIQHLGQACEEWGFFMVINHGVLESLQGATMDACEEMFNLPREENAEYMNVGPMAPIINGTVSSAGYNRNYVRFFTHPDLHIPEKPANLRENVTEYADCTRGLMLELTMAISESPELDKGRIAEALNLQDCFQLLALNQYPPAVGTIGLPPHSDPGLLALLFQNGVDGLQVQKDGHWILAKPVPNSLFVIVGDQLEIVSNGRYKTAPHRTLIHGEQARLSSVSMMGPCMDVVVKPIPELAPKGVDFRGMKYREYMDYKLRGIKDANAALLILPVQRDEPQQSRTNA